MPRHQWPRLATPEERFWQKVDRSSGPDDCWPWLGAVDHGYPVIRRGGQRLYAARVAWEYTHGLIPTGHMLVSTCETDTCINPAHRAPRIQEKLSAEQHAALCDLYATGRWSQSRLARLFGLTSVGVCLFLARRERRERAKRLG